MSGVAIVILVAIIVLGLGAIGWVLLQDAFVKIKPGEIGLVVRRGKPGKGLQPGTHFNLRFGRVIEIYPSVELTYLSVPDSGLARTPENELTFVDPPVLVGLGDMDSATVQYTVRFRLSPEGLATIHTRFGTAGIKAILRDESRRVLISVLGSSDVTWQKMLGPARASVEERLGTELAAALTACGFEMTMFNLREADLGETSELIQSTLRTAEELGRERARGAVRALRASQEVELQATLAGKLTPEVIEYLRVQATREFIDRWDGKLLTTGGLPGMPALETLTATSEAAPPPEPQPSPNQRAAGR